MKVQARVYKGIEFIEVEELPSEQRLLLKASPNLPERIKILVDGRIIGNCISYAAYSEWFEMSYKSTTAASTVVHTPSAKNEKVIGNFAFDKA